MNLKEQIQRFYAEFWDACDFTNLASILHPDFVFRGSLGEEKRGHAGFRAYVEGVHAALDGYRCTILEMAVEGEKGFAKMAFSGVHRGPFLGYAPTGEAVRWLGCAFFRREAGVIVEVWVLGDIKNLESLLERQKRC